MTENPKPQSFGWPFWLVLAFSVSAFFLMGRPRIVGGYGQKKARITEAVSNLRQIGLSLHEFEKQHGTFPSNETADSVKKNHPSITDLSGTSSNALFRQLFAAGVVDNEAMFYAKVNGTRKPDSDTSPGNLLEKGEVAFAYVAGLSTERNPARPVAFAPIIPGTKKFDPKPFDRKAVILRVDGSVTVLQILPDGHVNTTPGQDIFSPTNPIWDGSRRDIYIK